MNKKMKLRYKAVLSLVLSAVLFCMPAVASLPQREARNGWMRECIRLWFPISGNTAANREKSMSASGGSWAMYQRLSCLPAEKRKALMCGEMR